MKDKLELKHLAYYLPYGLRVLNKINSKATVCDLTSWNIDDHLNEKSLLILRPLSDLTKEIVHNGERFVPYDRIKEIYNNTPQFTEYKENWIDIYGIIDSKCEYVCVEKLFSWHFDVFGLIDKGLAIDINTLKD